MIFPEDTPVLMAPQMSAEEMEKIRKAWDSLPNRGRLVMLRNPKPMEIVHASCWFCRLRGWFKNKLQTFKGIKP